MFEFHEIKRHIIKVAEELTHYKRWIERSYGLFRVTAISTEYALLLYDETIKSQPTTKNMEPLSGLFCDTRKAPALIQWSSKKETIGEKITVQASAEIRPEFDAVMNVYARHKYPMGSTGGIYCRVPSKSRNKVAQLARHGQQFLQPPLVLGEKDLWIDMWAYIISERAKYNRSMLDYKDKAPDIFSKGNLESGTGLVLQGRRLKRKDLDTVPKEELEFLNGHMVGSAIMFAACQIAEAPNSIWLIDYLDPRVVGAVGSRSDGDILDARYESKMYSTISDFETRQIFANGGVLANADGEKMLFGNSVSTLIWKGLLDRYNMVNCFPPFKGLEHLAEAWTTGTLDSTSDPLDKIVIGQDIGMIEPFKAGADTLFCKSFVKIGLKCMPDMGSGAWWTMLAYIFFHIVWTQRLTKLGIWHKMLTLGDDVTTIIQRKDYEALLKVFAPYVKIKGTRGSISKILGILTIREKDIYHLMITPRIQKTISSASQASSVWAEALPNEIPDSGYTYLSVPTSIETAIQEALPVVMKLAYMTGTKDKIHGIVMDAWRNVSRSSEELADYLPNWVKYWDIDKF